MIAAWLLSLSMLVHADAMAEAWRCLDRGDAAGAGARMAEVPRPASDDAALASWLDARSRIAWAQGRMDQAFALGVQAVVVSERCSRELPSLTPSLTPGRTWVDEGTGLPRLLLPAGDGDGAALAVELRELPEASRPEGAWIVCAARLLDASVPAPATPKDSRGGGKPTRAERRTALLQAAMQARRGEAKSAGAAAAALRSAAREGSPLEAFARWFEAEAAARGGSPADARLASLRFVQAAALADDSPWLRVRALDRAAALLETIDPQEAGRLHAASRKENP